ncbi:amino acid permease-domain-containing protein [Lobosporangium transversale]|uniref:Amino acid permease-domain-containing protein n=1 Tax=Lobosporangium transversale TaxID=64571 RepID=A0A1Y2GV41_9FUNG|nr:amino acid permease-domain-containing protein [Lobosporangium transversale]ORZ24952.1 amino acid permease-domain-containing protein [Lobosporangium transversale]|eukprot:XP_021883933.1 amino acid permease-domain-containing protein [Lobosporangium transversale]
MIHGVINTVGSLFDLKKPSSAIPKADDSDYNHYSSKGFRLDGQQQQQPQRLTGNHKAGSVFPTQLNPALAATKSPKLGTISGVFVPCVLSIWGIILFLRFGFIIGQAGIMGTLAMFVVGYAINVFTAMSLSAISTNGTVRGGGVYYLLSRSLGPEFGGSIGLIYFLCTVVGCGMNVLGFVEPLIANFGETSGTVYRVLPESSLWGFIYGTILLVSCTLISLVGAKLFARSSLVLAVIILLSTLSIFISFAIVPPFSHLERNIVYTGFTWETLQENMWPKFTSANGPEGVKQSFQTVFGVLFPACIGILAGASMSGDLEDPSKSIPKGTLWAVASTFCVYTSIVILMGGSISRTSMHTDLSILQDVSISPLCIASGALAASIFATLSCVIGAAKILQAIARDNLLPLLSLFGQGTPKTDEPTLAVLLTYVLCQFCLFLTDMNAIATFVSLITLLTYLILNLACFLLKIGSAPNFRPSFRFFHWWTAFVGMVLCAIVMGFVDLGQSLLSALLTAILFIWIHYSSPPKRWGDVTQSLIYHQVRKYLLRLDSRKEHVKFWRPQILLLVHHPRSEFQLIQFCNHLKKGALYVLGHVIQGDLKDVLQEYRRQQNSWLKFVDILQIKAFVNLIVADSVRIGARNLLMGTGLGGMRPNIVVLGSFNLQRYHREKQSEQECRQRLQDVEALYRPKSPSAKKEISFSSPHLQTTYTNANINTMDDTLINHTLLNIPTSLPTDNIRVEAPIRITDYVSIIEDVLSLNKAVAIGYGFERLEFPEEHKNPFWQFLKPWSSHSRPESHSLPPQTTSASRSSSTHKGGETSAKKKYIDLWPMQMSVMPLQCFDSNLYSGPKGRAFSDCSKRASRDHSSSSMPSSIGATAPESSSTNFETYAMVLQMGCILHMVPQWRDKYVLRVMVFVEYREDVEEEEKRLAALLENLRIPAETKVICLDGGDSETYERLVKGIEAAETNIDGLGDECFLDEYAEEETGVDERIIVPSLTPPSDIGEGEGGHSSLSLVAIQHQQRPAPRENLAPPSLVNRPALTPSAYSSASQALLPAPQRRRTISYPVQPSSLSLSISHFSLSQRPQGPNAALRVNTALSPRLRSELVPMDVASAYPLPFRSTVSSLRGSAEAAEPTSSNNPRLGTSVPSGGSIMNFRIAVPLPRKYFDSTNGGNSSSESDSNSENDDNEDEVEGEEDDNYQIIEYTNKSNNENESDEIAYSGRETYSPQQQQQQQQRQRPLAQSASSLAQKLRRQHPLHQTPTTLSFQQQLQAPASAFAHTFLGSEQQPPYGLDIVLGTNSVDEERQRMYTFDRQQQQYLLQPLQHPSHISADASLAQMESSINDSSKKDGNTHDVVIPVGLQQASPLLTSSPSESISHKNTPTLEDSNLNDKQPKLQFDHLSPEAQLMILNELMRIHSSAETTSIVFTTAPAPEEGTCLQEQSSLAYLETLDLLMNGIDVPVLLLHAKSLTVTMTL